MESKHLNRAIQCIELGRFDDAIPYLQNAISEDPNQWESKYYLAICYYSIDNIKKASQITDGLIQEAPNNPEVLFLKAKIALQQNRFDEAETFVNNAIAIHPFNADYYGFKAAVSLHKKKYDPALNQVNEGLKIDPKNSYCLNIRAQILTKLNRVEEANETVDNILHDNPEDAYSHTNVGWVALENGDNKKALDHFKQALQLDPNFQYARDGMSTALKSKNILYKWYLKYSFWLGKQSTKNQWFFIIGLYLAYRFSFKLLSANGLTYVAVPLMVLYLLFALGGWIMEPLSNAILNFDNYGKYLLQQSEKISGYVFGALALLGVLSLIVFYGLGIDYALAAAITFICTLIPLPRAFLLEKKKSKSLGIAYGTLMLAIGLIGPVFIEMFMTELAVFIMMIAYTWLGNFIED